jgi:hypothetical protein
VSPKPLPHGNTIYPFIDLQKVGDFFVIKDVSKKKDWSRKKRYSIATAVKNFNKKKNTTIKVSTTITEEGLMVERIE